MNNGYFILSRNIFDSAIWRENPHVLKLFVWILGAARHKAKPKKYPGFEIKRGELVTSLSNIADDNEYLEKGNLKKWSRQRVSRMLKTLSNHEYVSIVADTYGTHIKVCNYLSYQDQGNYQTDSDGTGALWVRYGCVTGAATYNKDKKDNKDKKEEEEYIDRIQKIFNEEVVPNYPFRNNKKLHLTEARWWFLNKIAEEDIPDFLIAIKHYKENQEASNVQKGIGVPDLIRFMRFNPKGGGGTTEPWREWVDPEEMPLSEADEAVKKIMASLTPEELAELEKQKEEQDAKS